LNVEPGQPFLVAIGDSYMSGEGADEFFERTNTAGVGPLCRRAPTAYPVLLATASDPTFAERVAFFACSGAVTSEVQAQFDSFEAAAFDAEQVQLLLVSAGGNDALFGVLGRACLLPGDCADFAPAFMSHLEVVRTKLDQLYGRLARSTEVSRGRIAVVPYPVPISAEKHYLDGRRDCDYSPLSPQEHRFLHDYTVALNTVVVSTARTHGLQVVDTMPDALVGARVCDAPADEVGVNFIALNSIQGSLDQSILPVNWVHNSLHPNARGHKLMAQAIAQWWCLDSGAGAAERDVTQCTGGTAAPVAPDGSVPPDDDSSGPCMVEAMDPASSKALQDCVYERAYQKTAGSLFYPGSVIIAGLLALWALVYAVASELRRRLGGPWNEPAPPLAAGA
jgi:lysophospholipase L1-like esterase